MIISNKGIAYFILATAVYLIMTALFIVGASPDSNAWLSAWFYDKCYVFQVSIVYLIGCALIERHYNPLTYIRLGTRWRAILYQQMDVYAIAFIMLNIMFTIIVLGTVFIFGGFQTGGVMDLLNWYVRYLLGLLLLANLSLCFGVAREKHVRTFSQGLAFLILAVDLLAVTPSIKKISPVDFGTIFSWVFHKDTSISISLLIIFNLLLCLFQYKIGSRRDLYI